MSKQLSHYLRAYRKHGGLSQDELAFLLLGHSRREAVSRFERNTREPNLEMAFAYQAVFGVPAHALFPGIFEQVEQKIARRAELLSKQLTEKEATPRVGPKKEFLDRVASLHAGVPKKEKPKR